MISKIITNNFIELEGNSGWSQASLEPFNLNDVVENTGNFEYNTSLWNISVPNKVYNSVESEQSNILVKFISLQNINKWLC